eukprot:Selendium_serpulae@DN1303_c0_g1_i1.p1
MSRRSPRSLLLVLLLGSLLSSPSPARAQTTECDPSSETCAWIEGFAEGDLGTCDYTLTSDDIDPNSDCGLTADFPCHVRYKGTADAADPECLTCRKMTLYEPGNDDPSICEPPCPAYETVLYGKVFDDTPSAQFGLIDNTFKKFCPYRCKDTLQKGTTTCVQEANMELCV